MDSLHNIERPLKSLEFKAFQKAFGDSPAVPTTSSSRSSSVWPACGLPATYIGCMWRKRQAFLALSIAFPFMMLFDIVSGAFLEAFL